MPDAAIPIFQRVNEKGEATLEVEAVIKALGLTLSEKSIEEVVNTIAWENASGVKREKITGIGNEAANLHSLNLISRGNSSFAALEFANQENQARLTAEMSNGGVISRATIFNGFQQSRFLQVAGEVEKWTCNWGQSTVSFSGSGFSGVTNISHGIGRTPSGIFITSAGAGFPMYSPWYGTPTNTNIPVAMRCAEALTGTVAFSWFAIG